MVLLLNDLEIMSEATFSGGSSELPLMRTHGTRFNTAPPPTSTMNQPCLRRISQIFREDLCIPDSKCVGSYSGGASGSMVGVG